MTKSILVKARHINWKKKKESAESQNVNYFIISQGNLKPWMVKNYKKKIVQILNYKKWYLGD